MERRPPTPVVREQLVVFGNHDHPAHPKESPIWMAKKVRDDPLEDPCLSSVHRKNPSWKRLSALKVEPLDFGVEFWNF